MTHVVEPLDTIIAFDQAILNTYTAVYDYEEPVLSTGAFIFSIFISPPFS